VKIPSRERLRAQIADAYWRYETGKLQLAEYKRAYQRPGRHPSIAKSKAEKDPGYDPCVEDLLIARAEISAYCLTLLALHGEAVPWDQHCAEAVRHTIHTTQTGGA
jgi:hypothetical protein